MGGFPCPSERGTVREGGHRMPAAPVPAPGPIAAGDDPDSGRCGGTSDRTGGGRAPDVHVAGSPGISSPAPCQDPAGAGACIGSLAAPCQPRSAPPIRISTYVFARNCSGEARAQACRQRESLSPTPVGATARQGMWQADAASRNAQAAGGKRKSRVAMVRDEVVEAARGRGGPDQARLSGRNRASPGVGPMPLRLPGNQTEEVESDDQKHPAAA